MFWFSVYIIYFSLSFALGGMRYIDSSLWEADSEDCGKTRYDNVPLYMRTDNKALIGQFPWTARIGAMDPYTRKKFFYCGGSLISRHYVLTAAHCGQRGQIVRLGENMVGTDIDCDDWGVCAPPVQDINIKKFLVSDHCRLSNSNDIMVVWLMKPAIYSDFVQPICLPNRILRGTVYQSEYLLMPGFGTVYSGFGKVYPEQYPPKSDLVFNIVQVVDHQQCNRKYDYDIEDRLCIGEPYEVVHKCVADSGGALVRWMEVDNVKRAFLVGIASYNLSKCHVDPQHPVIFIDFGVFRKWVPSSIMNQYKKK